MTGTALRLFDPEPFGPESLDPESVGPAAGPPARVIGSRSSDAAPAPLRTRAPARAPALTPEQEAAVRRRQGSLLVSANAGSGKTSVLVERYVAAVVEDGLAPAQILAITFTERAAGELRQRIRDRLLALGRRDAARETDSGFVLTVHGFCARLLRAHPWAAGLDPAFTILDERAAYAAGVEAFRRALAGFLENETEGPELDLVAAWGPERVAGAVAFVHEQLRSQGERAPRLPSPGPAPDLEGRAEALDRARRELAAELSRCPRPTARVAEAMDRLERCGRLLDEGAGEDGVALDRLTPTELVAGNAALLQTPAAEAYARAWSAYRQACVDRLGIRTWALLDRLLRGYRDAYAAAKRTQAVVDFDDLELAARDLLREPSIRAAWAQRFELLMVDEFQDINPRQLEILQALERDNLFCVGDELQSIYRFRHAEVELFRRRRAQLADQGATAQLAHNFRARPELLAAINAAFAPIFGDGFIPLRPERPSAAADAGGSARPVAPLAGEEPRVELMLTDTRGWGQAGAPDLGATLPASPPWRHAEARLLAQRIDELIGSGQARAGDVAVLVRAASDLAVYERALEDRGLATLAAGGRGYWSAQQVQDLTAYLSVLANPLEEAALYGVLASPLGRLSSDGLAAVALLARERPGGAWGAMSELVAGDGEGPGPEAGSGLPALSPEDRDRLGQLHQRLCRDRAESARLPLATLLARAVRRSGYERYVLALRGGRRRRANVRKLIRLAAEFESSHGRDLRAFLDYVRAEERREAREGDAPLDGGEPDAVRLMTIHAAKGLEFPVVCVADLGRSPRVGAPWLIVHDGRVGVRVLELGTAEPLDALDYAELREQLLAAEDQEERRIVYVAMTRARERLLLSGAADLERWPCPRRGGAPMGWVGSALVPGLPEPLSEESPVADITTRVAEFEARVRVALNSPATVGRVLRLESEAAAPEAAPAPAPGPAPAVSPAPRALPEQDAVPSPQPQPAPAALSYSALTAYARCGYRFYVQWVLGLPDADPPARAGGSEPVPELDARTRGILVHALLEGLDFARPVLPTPARVHALARERGCPLPPGAGEDMIALVERFIASPLCARLARARGRPRREQPFALALDSAGNAGAPAGTLLTGVVDVMAQEGEGRVLIVDYKTDRLEAAAPTTLSEDYRIQRAVYALAALRAGAGHVEVAHCFLERPADLVSARYRGSDVEGLEAELRSLAQELARGRFPVAAQPHRELCLTCPARRTLCSWDETMTLRARPGPPDPPAAR